MRNIERFLSYGINRSKDLFHTAFETALKEAIAIGSAELVREITEHLIKTKGWSNGEGESSAPSTNRKDKPATKRVSNGNSKKTKSDNPGNS